MRKPASILALLLALFLLGSSFLMWEVDIRSAPERIRQGFEQIHVGDEAGLQYDLAQEAARTNEEKIEALAGAVFLITGIALYERRPRVIVESA